jgi:hypothetical protein
VTFPAYGVLRRVTQTASVLLCDNPGRLTLEGTNTWVLRAPGSDEIVVVDPGPDQDDHIARLLLLILDATAVSSNPSPRVRCSALEALSWLLESTAGFLDRRPDSTAGVLQALTRAISDGPTSVQVRMD